MQVSLPADIAQSKMSWYALFTPLFQGIPANKMEPEGLLLLFINSDSGNTSKQRRYNRFKHGIGFAF